VESFVMAMDSNLAPIVGQQITLDNANASVAGPRISLLIARANAAYPVVNYPGARECDLTVKGIVAGKAKGWTYSGGSFVPDDGGAAHGRAAPRSRGDGRAAAHLHLRAARLGDARPRGPRRGRRARRPRQLPGCEERFADGRRRGRRGHVVRQLRLDREPDPVGRGRARRHACDSI
jgi:hypothetical protein